VKRAICLALFAFGLTLPTQAAAPGTDYRLPPEDPVKAAHGKYTVTVEIVSDERLKRLSKLFRQTDHAKGVAIWRADAAGVPLGKCTIYLRRDASYDVFAHEAKHCIEGNFHPRQNAGASGNRGLPKLRQPGYSEQMKRRTQ